MQITVGITCFNNGDNIAETLNDVVNQQLHGCDKICEVLVVASGCTDNTVRDVKEFEKKDERLHLIIEPDRLGKPSAINKMIQQMRGDALLLMSGDVRLPQREFVEHMVQRLQGNTGVVSCRPKPVNSIHTITGQMSNSMWGLHDKTLSVQNSNGLHGHAGEAFAIKREAVETLPSRIVNDDAYMVLRAQQKGFDVSYDRESIVLNRPPESIAELMRQRARIINGHNQLRKILGVSPDVLSFIIVRKPLLAFNIIEQEVREEQKAGRFKATSFLALITLELISHIMAKLHRSNNRWTPSVSAKWRN
ncbi:MAG: glycosyltransferase [Nitrososphaerota archaeon]|nr:glycosyltransferase [Nitrososphaerota archaeon]MDG6922586.1 glycosyltransferase [Nitrososphaerota archaeon]